MKNLETFFAIGFSEEFISALGWTLLHSLWQGALIALLLGIALLFLQKKSSSLRYNLSATAIVITLATFIGTFIYLYNNALANSAASLDNLVIVIEADKYGNITSASQNSSLFSVFVDYFNHHLPMIVVLWLLGVLVLSLRFLGGLAYLQRLKHSNNRPIAAIWQEQLEIIRQKVGVKKSITLLESAMVKVPMVVGYLKPIILLPIGTINALSQAEVEAILAHELAHIRRHDYLINLIQSVIDVLFFYHPAVWWMSNAVRTERENCCDDLALRVTGNSLIIAKALANLEAFRVHSATLSVAFTGNKNQLFNRISRLLGQPMKKNNHFIEGIIAIFIIIICLTTLNYNVRANSDINTDNHLIHVDTTKPMQTVVTVESIKQEEEILEEYIIIEEEEIVDDNEFFFAPASNISSFGSAATANINTPEKLLNLSKVNLAASNVFFKNIDELDKIELLAHPNDNAVLEFIQPNKEFPQTYTFNISDGEFDFDSDVKVALGELDWTNDNNTLFELKSDANDNQRNFASIFVKSDTSILDKLDDADIILIEGDKTIIIRKRNNQNAQYEKLAKERAKMAKQQMKREKEMLKRAYELEKRNHQRQLELTEKLAKEELKRAEELAKREQELVQKKYEIAVVQQQKRLEAEEKRMAERVIIQEERLARQQERLAKQKAEIKIRKEIIEKHDKVREKHIKELQKELIKDGILEKDETIQTINVNKDNDTLSIKVNGKKVPKNKIDKYKKIIDKQQEEIKGVRKK